MALFKPCLSSWKRRFCLKGHYGELCAVLAKDKTGNQVRMTMRDLRLRTSYNGVNPACDMLHIRFSSASDSLPAPRAPPANLAPDVRVLDALRAERAAVSRSLEAPRNSAHLVARTRVGRSGADSSRKVRCIGSVTIVIVHGRQRRVGGERGRGERDA